MSAKPIPAVNDLTRPFWQAASNQELRMQKCRACGHIRFPPGPVCTMCLSDACSWEKLSGSGTVLSHLVFHQGYSAEWKTEVPYSVVMVQLEEGPRMIVDVQDPERRHVEADLVGRPIRIVCEVVADGIGIPRAKVD